MDKSLLLLVSCFLSFSSLNAQEYFGLFYESKGQESELPFKLQTQVQNLEDFISRFNGYNNAYGKPIDPKDSRFKTIRENRDYWKTWRTKVIGSLFDTRLMKRDSLQNWKYLKAFSSVDQLSMNPSMMSAYLPVILKVDEKQFNAELELKYIELDGHRFEWIIHDVVFDDCQNFPSDGLMNQELKTNPNIYLPPNAHGNGFLLLQRELIKKRSIGSYFLKINESFISFESLLVRSDSLRFEPLYFQFLIDDKVSLWVDADFFIYRVELL